uniref:C2 domain-containing protein n=1 Tax=Schistosoma mansoni TaxID=6183 RepID=A0A5K4ENQ1_SCHMA
MNIPKKVNIIVQRGENLEYTSSLKKASKSRRWRVVFLGGEVKLASEYVDAEDGRPIWDCEVTLDLISPSDPITLLVIDGDNHNIGQVDIPLNQVPQTGNPNFDLSRLCYSDLKSKRKNSNAHGRLVYWIWAIDYWPPGTQANTTHHSKSLRGSLTHLGSKIRSKSKHRSKNDNDYTNGYQQSGINGSSSTLQVPGMSYNPFENDGTVSEFSGPMGLPPMYQSHSNSPYAQSEFGGSLAGSVKSTKQKNMLKKFKSKLSHSTLNLAEAAAKKAAGKDPYFQSLEKGSKSNLRGSQLSIGGSSYRASTSQLDLSTQPINVNGNYPSQSLYPRQDSGKSRISSSSFLDEQGVATPIQQRTDGVGEVSAAPFESPGSFHTSAFGAQPDDRPSKPIEDMTKRETAEYVTHLLKSLQTARTEITRLQIENDRLTGHSHESERELNEVRMNLATLRNRLLEDNLTQYLELPRETNGYMGTGSSGVISLSVRGSNANPFDNVRRESTIEPQSFLSKISSLGMNARLGNIIPPTNNQLQANGNSANLGGGGWW